MKEKLNELIKESMLNKTTVRTEVLRSIKTAFMNHETAKNATPLTESVEIAIIKKMVSQRRDSFHKKNCKGTPSFRVERNCTPFCLFII